MKKGAIIGAAAGSLFLVGAFVGGVVYLGRSSEGTPKADAATLTKQNVQVDPDLANDSDVLHKTADDLVGYGGYDALAANKPDMWTVYNTQYRDEMGHDIVRVTQDVQLEKNRIQKAQDVLKNLTMLQDLLKVADKNHGQTGADALKYYHRVAEDIHYYLTGQGEEYGVSHVEGGAQTVLDFLHSNGINAQ